MNNHHISNHVLVILYIGKSFGTPISGKDGLTNFIDIDFWGNRRYFCLLLRTEYLKKWYDPLKNILNFSTVIDCPDLFYKYVVKLGYEVDL